MFLDQLEALAGKRNLNNADNTGVNQRVLTTLLTEMDGVSERRGVYIIGAAVDPQALDEALIRPGRFDQVLYLGLPKELDRKGNLSFYIHSSIPVFYYSNLTIQNRWYFQHK